MSPLQIEALFAGSASAATHAVGHDATGSFVLSSSAQNKIGTFDFDFCCEACFKSNYEMIKASS